MYPERTKHDIDFVVQSICSWNGHLRTNPVRFLYPCFLWLEPVHAKSCLSLPIPYWLSLPIWQSKKYNIIAYLFLLHFGFLLVWIPSLHCIQSLSKVIVRKIVDFKYFLINCLFTPNDSVSVIITLTVEPFWRTLWRVEWVAYPFCSSTLRWRWRSRLVWSDLTNNHDRQLRKNSFSSCEF